MWSSPSKGIRTKAELANKAPEVVKKISDSGWMPNVEKKVIGLPALVPQ
jgi:hypothetical protein